MSSLKPRIGGREYSGPYQRLRICNGEVLQIGQHMVLGTKCVVVVSFFGLLHPFAPGSLISRGMEYGGDDHDVLFVDYLVNHAVREAIWVLPSNVLKWMATTVQERINGQGVQNSDNFRDEFGAQTFLLRIVPVSGQENILTRLFSDNDTPAHRDLRSRRRDFISSSGIEEPGSAWCAARRSSTSASSTGPSGGS